MLSKTEILQLIADKESDRIERTVSTAATDKYAQAICAFSNDLANHKQPGYLFIGVSDKTCELSGLKVSDELLRNIAAIRCDGNVLPQPAMTVHCVSFHEGDVLVVEVMPAHFPPVRYKGQIWVRIGPRKAIANEAEERFLIEKRTSQVKTFDEQPCVGTTLQDIDIDIFRNKYLPRAIDKEALENDHRDIKFQLASLRFYDLVYDCPTHAGILMFGKDTGYHFPAAYIQYVKFAGTKISSTVLADTQFSGNLITIVEDLNRFLKINIIVKRPVFVSILQENNIYNFSERAIREFLMNALMHRSYEITSPIKFYQYSDRIEIINPGGLYGNARPENFPNVSDYRNLIIAEAMRVMGYVNRFNRGIETSQQDLIENGNPPAIFDFDTWGVFKVVAEELPENLPEGFEKLPEELEGLPENLPEGFEELPERLPEELEGLPENLPEGLPDELKRTSQKIAEEIKNNSNITLDELSEKLNISRTAIKKHLSKLKAKGLLERVGAAKGGYWKIKNK